MRKQEKYFLKDKTTINKIIEILDLDRGDEIIELGAGTGSIAKWLNGYKKLILVEKDYKLCQQLKREFQDKPRVNVICTDAINHIKSYTGNKILSSLPSNLISKLFPALRKINFEFALIMIKQGQNLEKYKKFFKIEPVCQANVTCFEPRQPFDSYLVKITKLNKKQN